MDVLGPACLASTGSGDVGGLPTLGIVDVPIAHVTGPMVIRTLLLQTLIPNWPPPPEIFPTDNQDSQSDAVMRF